jgi:uncharacterized protein
MCVLMLSGPQTVGEIRTRGYRLFEFSSLEQVDETMRSLRTKDEPMVISLPRQPGQKEARFVHLLSGEAEIEMSETTAEKPRRANDPERVTRLEEQVQTLTQRVDNLTTLFEEFKKQFE